MSRPIIIDGHADTLHSIWNGSPRFAERVEGEALDMPLVKQTGLTAQFFAISTIDGGRYVEPLPRWALMLLDLFHRQVEAHGDDILHATCADDVLTAHADGKLAAFVALEGGDFLDGRIELLRMYHRLGVRLLVLTHFRRNTLADSTREASTGGRLTPFGVEVVREMERIGMIVDVSHVADAAVDHVFDIAEKPVVSSHANARAVYDHPRNMTDAHLRRLARNGGLIGLSIVPFFIDRGCRTFARFMDHMEHVIQTAGIDHVGFGSDFDGFDYVEDPRIEGLEDISCFARIGDALSASGYSDADVGKVLGGNWLRVVRDVLG
ncbi:peptidase [Candidatus Poribacteria bacterium]|nr:peptidase [Candidatus Poribacteria bacterium]